MKRLSILLTCVILLCFSHTGWCEQPVRIATYNIRWLSSETVQCGSVKVYDVRTQGERLENLQKVIEYLDADIIGLQEIRDRTALELIFNQQEWTLVIDDDTKECQNLALAVRKPFKVQGETNGKLNVGNGDYLFENESNQFFPRNRDLLCVEVLLPNNAGSLWVMVQHAKSRSGGRHKTNERRAGASRIIVKELEESFDEKNYVLIGDFNDNPDDESLNILENGNQNEITRIENEQGTFLVNLSETLLLEGHVSHGRKANDIRNDNIDTKDPASRNRNYINRNRDAHTGDILFDQILIPHQILPYYVQDSIKVFNQPIAVQGSGYSSASDHLPVYADFVFPTKGDTNDQGFNIVIAAMMPNPKGRDKGNEKVILKNLGHSDISLDGWKLRDKARNLYSLSGLLAAGAKKEIRMTEGGNFIHRLISKRGLRSYWKLGFVQFK